MVHVILLKTVGLVLVLVTLIIVVGNIFERFYRWADK